MNKGTTSKAPVLESQPQAGEKVFLFLWAILSNTKEWIMEYTQDVFRAITQNYNEESMKELRERKKRKKAYFQRLKHQMGVFTPEQKRKKHQAHQTSEMSDSFTKMEDLENQLMMLKEQIAIVSKQEKSPTQLRKSVGKHSAEKRVLSALGKSTVPPPPTMSTVPPPPPVSFNIPPPPTTLVSNSTIPLPPVGIAQPIKPMEKADSQKPAQKPAPTQAIQHTMSISDMIKKSGSIKLRPIQKSPGGTPVKNAKQSLQGELFAAIKNKFSNVNRKQEEDESDVESSSSFTLSPIKKTTKAASPKIMVSSPITKGLVKKVQDKPEDKENMSPQTKFAMARSNIAKLFEQ